MEKLKEIVAKRGPFKDYREFRNFIKNSAQHQLGWAELKKEIGFKNWRRQYFNVSSIKTKGVSLILKGETPKYFYFDILSHRAFKSSPQVKVGKDIVANPENFSLDQLNDHVPLTIVCQREIVIRHHKAVCGGGGFYLGQTLQVCIRKQTVPYLPDKALKLIIAVADEKSVTAGAWARMFMDTCEPLFSHEWENESYGGTHWEKGVIVITKENSPVKVSYTLHGAKRLRKEVKEEL